MVTKFIVEERIESNMQKIKIAFVCVHNSCRSQIAEALGKVTLKDVADVYSAGTAICHQINPDAVRLMKKLYHIDMELTQVPKLIDKLPKVDYVISMGCDVSCPSVACRKSMDWGLKDPSNQSDQEFEGVINQIAIKIKALKLELSSIDK